MTQNVINIKVKPVELFGIGFAFLFLLQYVMELLAYFLAYRFQMQ